MSKARDIARAGTALTNVDATELGYLDGVTSAVQTQIDSKASTTTVSTHTGASTGVHGVAGTVVGTSDTQTLTNKSISGSGNTVTNISLSTAVTGTLPIANGGTGATTQGGAANAVLPSQTSNSGKYLTTDGTNASWGTVSSGGMTLLASTTISGNPTAVTLSGFSQSYKHLLVTWQWLINTASSGTNYFDLHFKDSSNSAIAGQNILFRQDGTLSGYANSTQYIHGVWPIMANNSTPGHNGSCMVWNYADTTKEKSYTAHTVGYNSPNARMAGVRSEGILPNGVTISGVTFEVFGGAFYNGGVIKVYGVN